MTRQDAIEILRSELRIRGVTLIKYGMCSFDFRLSPGPGLNDVSAFVILNGVREMHRAFQNIVGVITADDLLETPRDF